MKRKPAEKTAPAAMTPLEELYVRPAFLLRRAYRVGVAIFDDEVGERFDVTNTQYGMLMAIASATDIDVAGTARLVGMDRASSHLAVKNLRKKGYVEALEDPKDRRRTVLIVTPAGKRLLRDGHAPILRAQERLMANLSDADRRHLIRILNRMVPPLPGAD
jgi:DNA-binding MarR family transcriptional regulator